MVEKKKLHKFENARLISARALELAQGAKPKVELEEGKIYLEKDYVKVAEQEYEAGLLDLEIHK